MISRLPPQGSFTRDKDEPTIAGQWIATDKLTDSLATVTMTVVDIDRSDAVTATGTRVTIGGNVAGLSSSAAGVLAMFSGTQNHNSSTSSSVANLGFVAYGNQTRLSHMY